MESTVGPYGTELIGPYAVDRSWDGLRDLERETAERARWCNHERISPGVGDLLQDVARSRCSAAGVVVLRGYGARGW